LKLPQIPHDCRSLAWYHFWLMYRMTDMNIASTRVDKLARRLARLTGEDVETAVERAVEERLSRVAAVPSVDRRAAMRKFFDRASRVPVKDARPIDEIVGYGRNGLPS